MKLSVIIPCYNSADTIATQLDALANQKWDEAWEVIVADNRSTDDSMGVVEGYASRLPHLQIVDASGRQGQPYARNQAVLAAHGESVAFCDADDVVGEGWVPAIGEALARDAFVASRFETGRLNTSWVQKSFAHTHPQERGLNRYRYPAFLPFAGGGGLGVRRALHQAVGGFDESLPPLEDTDFCFRLQLRGVQLHFVPDAVYHVRYRATLSGVYRQARGYGEYNVVIYKRYRPLGMPPLSVGDGLNGWYRLMVRLPSIRRRDEFARWLWQFGWRVGRVRGSLRHRVLAL